MKTSRLEGNNKTLIFIKIDLSWLDFGLSNRGTPPVFTYSKWVDSPAKRNLISKNFSKKSNVEVEVPLGELRYPNTKMLGPINEINEDEIDSLFRLDNGYRNFLGGEPFHSAKASIRSAALKSGIYDKMQPYEDVLVIINYQLPETKQNIDVEAFVTNH